MSGRIDRDSAQYRIGPLTTYRDAADLEQEFRRADVGGRVVYAMGPALTPGATIPAMMRQWQAQGLCHLSRVKRDGIWHYFAEKRPMVVTAVNAVSAKQNIAGTPEELLLRVLVGLPENTPMPSLDMLAERADLPSRYAADYRLRLLVEGGFVRVRRQGVQRFVEILKQGESL